MIVKTREDGGLFVRSKPGKKRPQKSPDEVRSYKIHLNLNKLEYDQFMKLVELKKSTPNEYLRSLIAREFARI